MSAVPVRPVECTAWCSSGDGHPDEYFPEDQDCWSKGEEIEVSTRPLVPVTTVESFLAGEGPSFGVDTLEVYLHRRAGASLTLVGILDASAGREIELTVGEAERLGEALLSAARSARA